MLGGITYKKKKKKEEEAGDGGNQGDRKGNPARESWMTTPMQSNSLIVQRKKKEAEEAARAEAEAKAKKDAENKAIKDRHKTKSSGIALVGDGGNAWKRRALQRMRERAKEEGRAEDEVVKEVWGSKEKLFGLNAKMKKPRGDSLGSWRRDSRRRRDDDDRGSYRYRRDRDRDDRRGQRHGRDRESRRREGRGDEKPEEEERGFGYARKNREAYRRDSESRGKKNSIEDRRQSRRNDEDKGGKDWAGRDVGRREGQDDKEKQRKREIEDAQALLQRAQEHAARNKMESDAASERRAFLYGSSGGGKGGDAEKAQAAESSNNTAMKVEGTKEELVAKANKLAAKAMRAKLKRKMDKYNMLMEQAEALREQAAQVAAGGGGGGGGRRREEETVALSQFDLQGRMIELGAGGAKGKANKGGWQDGAPPKKKRKPENKIGTDGKRDGYFDADLEKTDLKTLVQQERMGTANDFNANWAKHVMRQGAKFETGDTDEQFDMADVSMQAYESSQNKARKGKQRDEILRKKAVSAHNRMEKILANCYYCMDSPKHLGHLVVSVGVKCYLAIPSIHHVTNGHCLIIPREHIIATTQADEDVQEEIMYFRKFLVKMFAAQKQGCVFQEIVINLEKQRHTVIDCVPMPKDLFLDAPIFFKKAILESDEQWSVNKKLVDTREKGLWRSIPKNFPFFSVEFGTGGGFAHVIEDRDTFNPAWGKSVLCGMLGEPAQVVLRAKRAPLHVERSRVEQFKKMWHRFDWTRRLKGGDLHAKFQQKSKSATAT